jgi:hypothetical protein
MTDDFRPVNQRAGEVKDMPLVDDLADVLSRMVVGWQPGLVWITEGQTLDKHPDVVRVMARYRQSKIQQAIDKGRNHSE